MEILKHLTNGRIDPDKLDWLKFETKERIFELLQLELSHLRQRIANDSLKFIGYPSIKYKGPNSGINEDGFDCSGFISYVLQKYGLGNNEVRHSNEYFDEFGIFTQNPMPGDLIFFSRDGLRPTHMGICIGDNKYIHAPGKDGTSIEIENIESKAINGTNEKSLYQINPIGFKRICLSIENERFGRWKKVV